jgi:hypothetical protein
MKQYPSISKQFVDIPIIAFDKLDGSNIRSEWNKKNGFHKFGSRTRLLDPNEKPLGEAVSLIKSKYEKDLSNLFIKQRYEKVICFFEFFGEHSSFGQHLEEPHDVVLFDIDVYKKSLLLPRDFIKLVGHLDIPKVLYEGKANIPFQESVYGSTLDGMSFEGVVCKGEYDKFKMPTMFKIKSNEWLSKLKCYCGDNLELFDKLL